MAVALNDRALLIETAKSIRLVLRHLLTAGMGGGAPERALVHQMQRLDKLMGREWHDVPTGGQIHDIGKRKGSR